MPHHPNQWLFDVYEACFQSAVHGCTNEDYEQKTYKQKKFNTHSPAGQGAQEQGTGLCLFGFSLVLSWDSQM